MKNLNIYQKVTAAYFGVMVAFWAGLYLTDHKEGNLNYWYSFLFGLIPLFAGLVGMTKSSIWGGLKSSLGKAVFFISLGLTLWGLGETIWSYYNFFKHVPAPYPSLADIGFAPSIFFWILGTAFLSVATGAMFALKKSHLTKFLAFIAVIILLVPSYYIQIKVARGGVLVPPDETALKTVLDIAYPFGDFLALLFAAVVFTLSYKYFGGLYRWAVCFLLAGLAVMYGADTLFSYTTTKGTYYNANFGDLLLTTGLFLMSFGVLAFATKPKLKSAGGQD
jgi:diguanylate cyclase